MFESFFLCLCSTLYVMSLWSSCPIQEPAALCFTLQRMMSSSSRLWCTKKLNSCRSCCLVTTWWVCVCGNICSVIFKDGHKLSETSNKLQLLFICVSGVSLVFRFDSLAVMVGITHSELMHLKCITDLCKTLEISPPFSCQSRHDSCMICGRIPGPQRFIRDWPVVFFQTVSPPSLHTMQSHSLWTQQLHVCPCSSFFRVHSLRPCVYSCASSRGQRTAAGIHLIVLGRWRLRTFTLTFSVVVNGAAEHFCRYNWFKADGKEKQVTREKDSRNNTQMQASLYF